MKHGTGGISHWKSLIFIPKTRTKSAIQKRGTVLQMLGAASLGKRGLVGMEEAQKERSTLYLS